WIALRKSDGHNRQGETAVKRSAVNTFLDKRLPSTGLTGKLVLVITSVAAIGMATALLVAYLQLNGTTRDASTSSIANDLPVTSFWLTGIVAIGALVATAYYASNRFLRPIRRLRDGARRIAGGDFTRPLDLQSGDDIGEIAGCIDELREQLRHLIKTSSFIGRNLEKMVEERTQELEHALVEKERVVDQLIHAEKLAAIGTMASGIGHEINNPLYAILGSAEAIRDEIDIRKCHEESHGIIKHSKDIAKIVQNLSGYIRPASDHELEAIDLGEKLCDALSMARRSVISDQVEIKKDLPPVPDIRAKSEEIQQVFFNIIRNGIQAMQGGGVLEVSVDHEGDRIRAKIRDSGAGIPEGILKKIFDPFFTTKGPDEGEGLGLYIVHQIVKKYEGTIDVESQPGSGTTFTIQFPAGKPIS
ncbi:MAG: ATP-binding protein, partial [Woeseia sp.]